MTTIPVQGSQIKYSDIQKAFGGTNSNSLSTATLANSLNTNNNYTIAGLSLGSFGNISNVGTITANTYSSTANFNVQTTSANDILFKTNSTENMRILANGNVGIGVTIPTYKLDVNGSINTNEYYIKGYNLSNSFMSLKSINVTNVRNPINEITSVAKITYNENYYYYVFTNTGGNQTSYTITLKNPSICDILVVGGGGAGDVGGGGSGQLIFNNNISILPGTYNIDVGNGGTNSNGYDSVFNTTIAKGGYYDNGGSVYGGKAGNSGNNVTTGGSGVLRLSHNYYSAYGGGGGAGGNGASAYYTTYVQRPYGEWQEYYGGNGGAGVDYSSYFNTTVGHDGWFASGGGGGKFDMVGYAGNALKGGGGKGSVDANGINGLANTGGGGGGRGYINRTRGKGGSGVVIIRLLKDDTPILKLDLI